MKRKVQRRLFQIIVSVTASVVFSVTLWSTGFLGGWENKVWDMQSRMMAAPSPHSDDITLVLVDQGSLQWVHKNMGLSWPWPRELYGAIINSINRHGAKAVGFDVLFTEASAFGVSDDAALGQAIAATDYFAAGSVFSGWKQDTSKSWPEGIPRPQIQLDVGANEKGRLPSYDNVTMPIADVAQNADILCNVHHDPDQDGIYRSLHPLVIAHGLPLPALGLGMALANSPQALITTEEGRLNIGSFSIPVDKGGRALLRFRGPPGVYKRITAASLIKEEMTFRETGAVDPANDTLLHDKYVLFGFSAPGLFDLRPTPVGAIFSGVEINATLLDNVLNGDFIAAVDKKLQIVVLCICSLLLGTLLAIYSRPIPLTLVALAFLISPVGLSFGLYSMGYRYELLALVLAIGNTIVLSLMIGYLQEGRQRRFIKHSFAHYLSPQVIEQLIQDPGRLQLGGDRKELSIFFSDLQGFTSISENLDPDDLIRLLNDYLSAMSEIILEEGGTIDKYEGDAIIAFWNAPLETPDHAVRAVSAALRCQKRLAELRPLFLSQCGHEMHMRIGINSGPAVVGNLGSAKRFDYSMLGDAVNLAARLEGANKQFDSYTMLSEATHRLLNGEFRYRELARLTVVGRKEPVRVYEPFFTSDYKEREKSLKIFHKGLMSFYDGDFETAMVKFKETAQIDATAQRYLKKTTFLLEHPPVEWQGVWSLSSK
jgi:adenylate cyclase